MKAKVLDVNGEEKQCTETLPPVRDGDCTRYTFKEPLIARNGETIVIEPRDRPDGTLKERRETK